MVFGAFKSLFGGDAAPAPAAATGPFGVGLGRAVTLDLIRLRLEEARLAHGLPPETLVISAHGVAELDGESTLHRYYDDSGAMLQVLCAGGVGDDAIREITIYHPWDEVVPTTDAEWAGWDGPGGKIGAAVFEADGFRFERVWGEPATAWVQPAEFTEAVATDEVPERLVHQKIVPYRREVGTAIEALIIAVERDVASADRGSVTFMIGYGLQRADVTAV